MSEFVTDELCKERRESCEKSRVDQCESRDAWIKNIQTKVDNLVLLAIGQLCALVLTLIGVIFVLMQGR